MIWKRGENVWKRRAMFILKTLQSDIYQRKVLKANNSSHGLYRELDWEIGIHYMRDSTICMRDISLIIKARGGLLGLATDKQSRTTSKNCTLCNNEEDTIADLLGRCQYIDLVRVKYFGISKLSQSQVIYILNGAQSWKVLSNFINEI